MAPQLSHAEVARIAELARLDLRRDEIDVFTVQLTDILHYAASIQQIDTTDADAAVESAHAGLRDDEPVPSLARETVLAEAPGAARDAGLFRVPKVL